MNWKKEFDKMSEVNEFWGLPYDKLVDKSIKSFINNEKNITRQKAIKECVDKWFSLNLRNDNKANWEKELTDFSLFMQELKSNLTNLLK